MMAFSHPQLMSLQDVDVRLAAQLPQHHGFFIGRLIRIQVEQPTQ